MINEEKVKLMTHIAIYEEHNGKEDLKKAKFYKSDFVKYNVLKSLVGAVVAYAIILIGYAMYKADEILVKVNAMQYTELLKNVLIGLIVFIVLYAVVGLIVFSIEFEKARPGVMIYNHNLKKLSEFYTQDKDKSPKNVKERGALHENDEFIEY